MHDDPQRDDELESFADVYVLYGVTCCSWCDCPVVDCLCFTDDEAVPGDAEVSDA